MKTRLPKMLLAALLAAMAHSYADITPIGEDRYYSGTEVITSVDQFGTGDYAGKASTVNIGWGDGTTAKDANITLSGNNAFTTPNALFIGGRGWNRGAENVAACGVLTLEGGASLTTASKFASDDPSRAYANHVTMGNCPGAQSVLNVKNGSVNTGSMDVSVGGGNATVNVAGQGTVNADFMRLGTNGQAGESQGVVNVDGGTVYIKGHTSAGYQDPEYSRSGGTAKINVSNKGEFSTGALTLGANIDDAVSVGEIVVNGGTLTVRGDWTPEEEGQDVTWIGIAGGTGIIGVLNGGVADMGSKDIVLGDGESKADITVENSTFKHNGVLFINDIEGNAEAAFHSNAGSTVVVKDIEVSRNGLLALGGNVTQNGSICMFDGSSLAGAPVTSKAVIEIINESDTKEPVYVNIVHDEKSGLAGFETTLNTTLECAVNTHLQVEEDATLSFGQGVVHLQDGILYIDSLDGGAGTITLASSSSVGYISLKDNANLHGWVSQLSAQNPEGRVALIDTSNFQDGSGYSYGVFTSSQSGQLVARDLSALYVIKFTDKAVSTLNAENFKGFYLQLLERYPAEDAYDDLDRNEQVAFDTIKELDKDIENLPPDLQEIVHEVLNTPGDTQANELAKVLDALNGSTMAVMMHNQIEGNLAQQRRLRSRAYNGRNLRHDKGCTDIYAEAFYDNQHVDYRRSAGMGHNRNEWGGLIGGDTCIGKNWRVGADFAMSWSHVNPTGGMKFKQNSMYMDVYATVHKGNWRSITGIGLGLHNFDVKRGMNGNVWAKADDVKGTAINITEEVAYDYHYSDKTVLQPYVAIDMNINRIDEFTDTGLGSANLHCRRQSAFATDITIGGRYIHDFSLVRNAPDATWTAQLGVTASVGDTTADLDLNFVGAPDKRFIITTPKRDVVGLNVGTGLTVPVSEHTAIYGGVQAIIRGDSHSFDANLGVRYAF